MRTRMFAPDEPAGEPGPDLMGYPNVEALVSAKRASDGEVKRMAEKLNSLEQQFQSFSRPQVPQRFSSPEEELGTYGVPVQALDAYVNRSIEKAFAPIAQGMQARNQVISRYPDYAKFEADVAKYVESDPEMRGRYQKVFQSDPEAAMEYAMLKYSETQRDKAPAKPRKSSVDASIPSTRSGDTRTAPSREDDNMQRAFDHYQKTGNPEAYAKMRIGQVLTDEFLGR